MKKFDVDKYLRKNPAPPLALTEKFRFAAVIPAYDENEHIHTTLSSIRESVAFAGIPVITIVVINYPSGADPRQSEALFKQYENGDFPADTAVIYLPELSGGVGAARKAGMDAFIHQLSPEDMEKSVIFSIDADTVIEKEYFTVVLPEVLSGGAVSIPFSHQKAVDPAGQQAINRYEAYLQRYVDCLKYADSPYAFHSIGSAFAVRADTCIRAGGMKVRSAGEDFYFLQAVAKSSGVRQLSGRALVHPSARISERVPFGTGPAVASLLAGNQLNEIPDEAFEELKLLLAVFRQDENLKNLPESVKFLSGCAEKFLVKEGFFNAWENMCRNIPDSAEKRQKAFHEWFDGLKTLKFLHFFSDLP